MLERMWRKGNPHVLLVGVQIDTDTMENSMETLKKLKIELSYDPEIPFLGIYLKKAIIQKDICTPIVHCSTIYNSQDREAG